MGLEHESGLCDTTSSSRDPISYGSLMIICNPNPNPNPNPNRISYGNLMTICTLFPRTRAAAVRVRVRVEVALARDERNPNPNPDPDPNLALQVNPSPDPHLAPHVDQVFATNYIAWAVIWLCKMAVPLGVTFVAHLMIQGGGFGVDQDRRGLGSGSGSGLGGGFDALSPTHPVMPSPLTMIRKSRTS